MLDFIGLIIVIILYAFVIIFPLILILYCIFTPITGLSWQSRLGMGLVLLLFLFFIMWLIHGDNIKVIFQL